jgi:RNA polymerase sigma factor (sigma-70 family)
VTSQSDNQIMLKVRDGYLDKLSILFERYQKTLFNFFLRLTKNRAISEDLVQEVFLRILKYRHTYRGDGKFTNWMFHISRNAHFDYYKKQSREQPLTEHEPEHVSQDSNPEVKLEETQDVDLLRLALTKLSLEKREVLVLSRFHNMKYEDIAEIQDCRVGTIKARVHRAIKELRDIYFELSGESAS